MTESNSNFSPLLPVVGEAGTPAGEWASETTSALKGEQRTPLSTSEPEKVMTSGADTPGNPWSTKKQTSSDDAGLNAYEISKNALATSTSGTEPPIPPRSSLRPTPSETDDKPNFTPLADDLSDSAGVKVPASLNTLMMPSTVSTPGYEVPGAYPREITAPGDHVDVGAMLESAKQYVPGTDDIKGALTSAGETAAEYSAVMMAKLSSLLPGGMTAKDAAAGTEQMNEQIREFGTNGRTYVDSITGLAVHQAPTPAFEIPDPTNALHDPQSIVDKATGPAGANGEPAKASVQVPETTKTVLDHPDSMNDDESGAGTGVAGVQSKVSSGIDSISLKGDGKRVDHGANGVGVVAGSNAKDLSGTSNGLQRAKPDGDDRDPSRASGPSDPSNQEPMGVRFAGLSNGEADGTENGQRRSQGDHLNDQANQIEPHAAAKKTSAPTPPPKDGDAIGRLNSNGNVGRTSQSKWGQPAVNTAPTHDYSVAGAGVGSDDLAAPSQSHPNSHGSSSNWDSHTSSDVHRKSTFKEKMKGEMKIIKGKLGRNADEVEAGQKMKAGF